MKTEVLIKACIVTSSMVARQKKVSWQIVNLLSEQRKFPRTMNFMQKQRKKEKVYLTWKMHNSASNWIFTQVCIVRREKWVLKNECCRSGRSDMICSVGDPYLTSNDKCFFPTRFATLGKCWGCLAMLFEFFYFFIETFSAVVNTVEYFYHYDISCAAYSREIFPNSHFSIDITVLQVPHELNYTENMMIIIETAWINFQRHFCKPPKPAALENIKILFALFSQSQIKKKINMNMCTFLRVHIETWEQHRKANDNSSSHISSLHKSISIHNSYLVSLWIAVKSFSKLNFPFHTGGRDV